MSRTIAIVIVIAIVIAIVMVAGCSGSPPHADQKPVDSAAPVARRPDCGASNEILTGNQVGAIRLGMPADSLKHFCPVLSDSTEHPEGQPTRVIRIPVGEGTLRVWANNGVVYNVLVETSHFRTADSIRVGSPLLPLLRHADLTGGYGEGDFYVFTNAAMLCGLSFQLDFGARGTRPPPRRVTPESLKPFASAKVRAILVRGCRPNH